MTCCLAIAIATRAWAREQAGLLRRGVPGLATVDATEVADFLEEWADEMHDRIDMTALWKRARRKIEASLADYGEPAPKLPADCPLSVDELTDPDLNLGRLIASVATA